MSEVAKGKTDCSGRMPVGVERVLHHLRSELRTAIEQNARIIYEDIDLLARGWEVSTASGSFRSIALHGRTTDEPCLALPRASPPATKRSSRPQLKPRPASRRAQFRTGSHHARLGARRWLPRDVAHRGKASGARWRLEKRGARSLWHGRGLDSDGQASPSTSPVQL